MAQERLVRLYYYQDNYGYEYQHRRFIEPPVKDVAAPVAAMPEVQHELAAVNVIRDQQGD